MDHLSCNYFERKFFVVVAAMLLPLQLFAYELFGFEFFVANEIRQQSFVLASKRALRMLPEANGGPSYNKSPLYDPRSGNPITCSDGNVVTFANVRGGDIDATLGYLTSDALKYGSVCQGVYGHSVPAYAGNINSDDWRLNFDKGDFLQAPLSLNSTIDMKKRFSFGDFIGRMNVEALFDEVLTNDASFERSALTSAGRDKIARYVNLDGYAILKSRIASNRLLNISLGQQEIHWGERTFLPGGIAWFNPLNVSRFRQTGYEHGWIPVPALLSELVWSRSLSFSGYLGGWNRYALDVPGTYSGIGGDVWVDGASAGGNQHRFVVGSGSYFTGNSWPCHYNDANYWEGGSINTNTQTYANALSAYAPSCPGPSDVLTKLTTGLAEKERADANDSWAMIPRGADEDGSRSYGLMSEYQNRKINWSFQFSYQGGDSRVPIINYYSDQPSVMPYATGVMDGVIARGATVTGLVKQMLLSGSTAPYNTMYNSVMLNSSNGLVDTLKSQVPALDTYGATPGSVAEMNALQYQLAIDQIAAVNPSTREGFEDSGAAFTGSINIRPDFNLGIYGVYPHEDVYGVSAKYIGFGQGQIPFFVNMAYRPHVPLQFDLNELSIAGLFNNCMMTSTGVYEGILLNKEPYHNEFDTGLGQNRVGCRDYRTVMPGYTTQYDGLTVDLVGQGLFSDRRIFKSDRLFGRLQMRSIYAGGISERANMARQKEVNGILVTGPLMPLENVCASGSDLPLASIVGLDPRSPIICRPTEYSMGLLFGGGLDYNGVVIFGSPYTITPGIFYSRGMIGRTPKPLGVWLKDVGYYIVGLQAKNSKHWVYELQYRGYFGPALYNSELGSDAVFLSFKYMFNLS